MLFKLVNLIILYISQTNIKKKSKMFVIQISKIDEKKNMKWA